PQPKPRIVSATSSAAGCSDRPWAGSFTLGIRTRARVSAITASASTSIGGAIEPPRDWAGCDVTRDSVDYRESYGRMSIVVSGPCNCPDVILLRALEPQQSLVAGRRKLTLASRYLDSHDLGVDHPWPRTGR